MKKQSSYIFFNHPSNEKQKEEKDGTILIEAGNNVYSYISKTFPSVKSIIDKTNIFNLQCKGDINACHVVFTIHEVASVEYLDISVEGKTVAQIIGCLEQIQGELFNSGIRKYYVDIISFDAISEYYCNKMFVKLNTLERNLRKLMLNIYILNFGKDYYKATMGSDLQDKIKKLIGSSTSNENIKSIKNAYDVSNEQAKSILRMNLFFYHLELSDMQNFLFKPNWTSIDEKAHTEFLSSHTDLSTLSDDELRNAFYQFTPKSDWDRFFSAKIPINNIADLIDSVRKYRNSVAHFKFFNIDDYKCCSKMVKQLNNAINEAIKMTEDVDFAERNTEKIKKALSDLVEIIYKNYNWMQRNIEKNIHPLFMRLTDS